MSGICAGRVVIITGDGRGLGRAHALAFARKGARLVINDTGVERDGTGGDHGPADAVVAEVRALGGEAVASYEDAADTGGAARLVQAALAGYGQLDVLVNNAGILRDRMLVGMTEDDWDGVIRTHLRGVFAPTGTPPRAGGSGPRPGRPETPGSSAPRPRRNVREPRPGELRRGQGRHRRVRADRRH